MVLAFSPIMKYYDILSTALGSLHASCDFVDPPFDSWFRLRRARFGTSLEVLEVFFGFGWDTQIWILYCEG